ncbi:tRNA (adenine(22)-N(1))-methyltransferase [Caldanaerobacter sp.]|uniref:tRNA (adenine(22)-N(1))-methyltransferase n=1 Tax=Caldanaerobacter sp. TaxID=2930036 RepID=UPI003C7314A2
MRLTKRLKTIVKYVPKGVRLADIGTDHGFIPIYLVKNGIVERVIATDLNWGSLKRAIENIEKEGLKENIDTRLGDGLKVLKAYEVEVAIIAGMGGLLIIKILEEGKEIAKTIKRFIFQPMKDADKLRRYLLYEGYKICEEDLVKERDKFYEIIVAEHGRQEIKDEVYYEIGPKLVENSHPLLKEYLIYKIKKIQNILNKLPTEDVKRKDLEEKIKKLEVLGYGGKMPDNSLNDG